MADDSVSFDVTFRDFQFLQGHMARRVAAKDKRAHLIALSGVVLCAVMLAIAIVIVSQSYRYYRLTVLGLGYPSSLYLLIILCLVAAILSLAPAIRLRLRLLRMQVSDDGPLLGATKLTIKEDGLRLDRPAVMSKYLWTAFQGVELAKNAIVLPVDNGMGLIVPAKAFASDSARLEFAAALTRHIEAAKRAA
jgi:hypothetical protein